MAGEEGVCLMWSDLPQVPSRYNAGQPRCLQCRHLRIDDAEPNVYANAFCSLMPSFGFFSRHYAACARFEASGDYSRIRNIRAANVKQAAAEPQRSEITAAKNMQRVNHG